MGSFALCERTRRGLHPLMQRFVCVHEVVQGEVDLVVIDGCVVVIRHA